MTQSRFPRPRSARAWAMLAAALVAAALVAFAATYFLLFRGSSLAPLALDGNGPAATGSPIPVSQIPGNWKIGEGSTAGYRVREKLAELPASSDAVGRTSAVQGSMTVASGSGGGFTVTAASLTVDVSSLKSDDDRRDNRIRRDGLESDRFPTATFVTSAPIAVPSAVTRGAALSLSATGDLTIHGVTKHVVIPLTARLSGGLLEVVGSITFPFDDYGMTPPSVGSFVSVESNATMEFDVKLQHA